MVMKMYFECDRCSKRKDNTFWIVIPEIKMEFIISLDKEPKKTANTFHGLDFCSHKCMSEFFEQILKAKIGA